MFSLATLLQITRRRRFIDNPQYEADAVLSLYPGRYTVECGTDALDVPFQKISTCVRMKQAACFLSPLAGYSLTNGARIQLPRCQAAMRRFCIDVFDEMNCRAAVGFCDSELSTPMRASGMCDVPGVHEKSAMTLCNREEQLRHFQGGCDHLHNQNLDVDTICSLALRRRTPLLLRN